MDVDRRSREFPAQGLGETADPEFAGGIDRLRRVADEAEGRAEVDEMGAWSRLEVRQQRLGQQDGCEQVRRQDRRDRSGVEILEETVLADAGVVDESVDPDPLPVPGMFDHSATVGIDGEIGDERADPLRRPGGDGLQLRGIASDDQHCAALCRKAQRDGLADPAAAAGHQDPPGKVHAAARCAVRSRLRNTLP